MTTLVLSIYYSLAIWAYASSMYFGTYWFLIPLCVLVSYTVLCTVLLGVLFIITKKPIIGPLDKEDMIFNETIYRDSIVVLVFSIIMFKLGFFWIPICHMFNTCIEICWGKFCEKYIEENFK